MQDSLHLVGCIDTMDALIMAGGRGSRLNTPEEKPLVKVRGKALLEHIINALRQSKSVDKIYVATSPYTPKTKELLPEMMNKSMDIANVDTSGVDYVADMAEAIRKTGSDKPFLVVCADIPMLSAEMIDNIVDQYYHAGTPALSVNLLLSIYEDLGITPDGVYEHEGRKMAPAGINIIDASNIDEEQEETRIVLQDKQLAFNINTLEDIETCESIIDKNS